MNVRTMAFLWAALAVASASPAAAQQRDEGAVAVIGGHLFAAGDDVRTTEGAEDDAFLAGGRITAIGTFQETLFAAGRSVRVGGPVGDDLYAAGQTVVIEGAVGDDLFATGQRVELREGARVGGDAFLAGRTVELFGEIAGDVHVGAGTLVITGTINGDVQARVDHLVIGPRARINGSLEYRAGTTDISPSAVIAGGARVREVEQERRPVESEIAEDAGWSVGGILGLTIMAALLQLVIPGVLNDAADVISARPLRAFGWGVLSLVGMPIIGVLLMITILGIPLGLLLWLVFAVLMGAATVAGAYWLGLRIRGLFDSTLEDPAYGGRVLWSVVGFIALGVILWVPILGSLFVCLLWLASLGSLVMAIGARFRAPRPVSANI
jgi:hypothetical protein